MIFPKPLDGADVKAQALPLLAAPWLFWAVMGAFGPQRWKWRWSLGAMVEAPRAEIEC
jgi:hypothetical protein